MRPQIELFLIAAFVLLFSSFTNAEQFLAPPVRDQMRKILHCQNHSVEENSATCHQKSELRLASHVLQLSYGALLASLAPQDLDFPVRQLRCQKAIARGSASYVWRWVDAIERGMTPEWADHIASRQLELVSDACNVTVVQNSNGITMPAAGGPCAFWTSEPDATVNAEELRVCLHRTLEFWTSYLYIPVQQ